MKSLADRTTGESIDGEGWWRRTRKSVQTALFGYDFFISYRHTDGAACARSLHARLEKRFDCFLDELHYEAGHNLPRMQSHALRRTRKLLVVVSPRAHDQPARGTDWLLAEVREFKRLASRRGAEHAIVPFGSLRTLNAEAFPASSLLAELPMIDDTICVIDDAVESNAAVSEKSVEKIFSDFRQVRRRSLRRIATGVAALSVVGAVTFAAWAGLAEVGARRTAAAEQAFRLISRAESAAVGADGAKLSPIYSDASRLLQDLGRDPVMALHGLFADRLHDLRIRSLTDLEGLVGKLTPSEDGDWILVVYYYQAANGSPDLEQIPDKTAFGVFHVPSRKWTLTKKLNTEVGLRIYQEHVEEFLPPDHVVLRRGTGGPEKVSLVAGRGEKFVSKTSATAAAPTPSTTIDRTPSSADTRLNDLLSKDKLFKVPPEDGIDLEYGPRLVDQRAVVSPDTRTVLIGTYEGKVLLVDRANGLSRGEMQASSIFDIAYHPNGRRAFVADQGKLFEVDTSGWFGVMELTTPLEPVPARETVLGAALSDDGATAALVTNSHILARNRSATDWRRWPLPKRMEKLAALRVDGANARIDAIFADDGAVVSASYASSELLPDVVRPPGAPAPVAGWLDPVERRAWLARTMWMDKALNVVSLALPGGKKGPEPQTFHIARPDHGDASLLGEDAGEVHALAKLGDRLIVFHGDKEFFSDRGSNLIDEQLLTVRLGAAKQADNRAVFKSKSFDNGPDRASSVTRVLSVLAGSSPDRIFVRTEFEHVYEIEGDKEPTGRLGASLIARYRDREDKYEFGISGKESDRWITIRHDPTGTRVRYQLPWGFRSDPVFAAIAARGRTLMLVSAQGDVMWLNVDKVVEQ